MPGTWLRLMPISRGLLEKYEKIVLLKNEDYKYPLLARK